MLILSLGNKKQLIFFLIGNNRDYLEEQKTLKDVLYALADLIDNDYQSDDNNKHLIIKS